MSKALAVPVTPAGGGDGDDVAGAGSGKPQATVTVRDGGRPTPPKDLLKGSTALCHVSTGDTSIGVS